MSPRALAVGICMLLLLAMCGAEWPVLVDNAPPMPAAVKEQLEIPKQQCDKCDDTEGPTHYSVLSSFVPSLFQGLLPADFNDPGDQVPVPVGLVPGGTTVYNILGWANLINRKDPGYANYARQLMRLCAPVAESIPLHTVDVSTLQVMARSLWNCHDETAADAANSLGMEARTQLILDARKDESFRTCAKKWAGADSYASTGAVSKEMVRNRLFLMNIPPAIMDKLSEQSARNLCDLGFKCSSMVKKSQILRDEIPGMSEKEYQALEEALQRFRLVNSMQWGYGVSRPLVFDLPETALHVLGQFYDAKAQLRTAQVAQEVAEQMDAIKFSSPATEQDGPLTDPDIPNGDENSKDETEGLRDYTAASTALQVVQAGQLYEEASSLVQKTFEAMEDPTVVKFRALYEQYLEYLRNDFLELRLRAVQTVARYVEERLAESQTIVKPDCGKVSPDGSPAQCIAALRQWVESVIYGEKSAASNGLRGRKDNLASCWEYAEDYFHACDIPSPWKGPERRPDKWSQSLEWCLHKAKRLPYAPGCREAIGDVADLVQAIRENIAMKLGGLIQGLNGVNQPAWRGDLSIHARSIMLQQLSGRSSIPCDGTESYVSCLINQALKPMEISPNVVNYMTHHKNRYGDQKARQFIIKVLETPRVRLPAEFWVSTQLSITPGELDSMQSYSLDGYTAMNGLFRMLGVDSVERKPTFVKDAMESVGVASMLFKLPCRSEYSDGRIRKRYTNLPSHQTKTLRDYGFISDFGFTSTSINRFWSWEGDYYLEIEDPCHKKSKGSAGDWCVSRGRYIGGTGWLGLSGGYSGVPHEGEVLFPPGVRFQLRDEPNYDSSTIQLNMVEVLEIGV